jgi:hypothetical protein
MVFPYEGLSLLVQTHKRFRNALIKLSPFGKKSAENEKLLSLAKNGVCQQQVVLGSQGRRRATTRLCSPE